MPPNSFSLSTRLPLPNGLTIPQLQLGVYLMSGAEASSAVRYALQAGYRAIDSAQMYRNEAECDIFFTSKLATNTNYSAARKSITQSIARSGLGYIDLCLLQSPYGGHAARLSSWKAIEDAITAGEIKTGGVSNYGIKHLEELLSSSPRIPPAVNQIEVHPFNTRVALTTYCRSHSILIQAYAPLARMLRMSHPVIVATAEEYAHTPAQVMVRWSLQRGYIALPKSVRRERIVENGGIDTLELEGGVMRELDGLDEGLVTDWDPTDAD